MCSAEKVTEVQEDSTVIAFKDFEKYMLLHKGDLIEVFIYYIIYYIVQQRRFRVLRFKSKQFFIYSVFRV